jgi:hypothetical protein
MRSYSWHGDPQTTKPIGRLAMAPGGGDEDPRFDDHDELLHDANGGHHNTAPDNDREITMLFAPPPPPPPVPGQEASASAYHTFHASPPQPSPVPHMNGTGAPTMAPPHAPPPPPPAHPLTVGPPPGALNGNGGGHPSDAMLGSLAQLAHNLMTSYAQLLKQQSADMQLQMEYLRRKEEREEADARAQREHLARQAERDKFDREHAYDTEMMKTKATIAQQLLETSRDESAKKVAVEYLKGLFKS